MLCTENVILKTEETQVKDISFDEEYQSPREDIKSSDNITSVEEKTGRWSREEHKLFMEGLALYGKAWRKIANTIKSRSVVQVRTHAQKYFLKLCKNTTLVEDVVDPHGAGCSKTSFAILSDAFTEKPEANLDKNFDRGKDLFCERTSCPTTNICKDKIHPQYYYDHDHGHHHHLIERLEGNISGSNSPTSILQLHKALTFSHLESTEIVLHRIRNDTLSNFKTKTEPLNFSNELRARQFQSSDNYSGALTYRSDNSNCSSVETDSEDVNSPELAEFLTGLFDNIEETQQEYSSGCHSIPPLYLDDIFTNFNPNLDFIPPSTESISLEPFLKRRKSSAADI